MDSELNKKWAKKSEKPKLVFILPCEICYKLNGRIYLWQESLIMIVEILLDLTMIFGNFYEDNHVLKIIGYITKKWMAKL
jgi:hypothetical protein